MNQVDPKEQGAIELSLEDRSKIQNVLGTSNTPVWENVNNKEKFGNTMKEIISDLEFIGESSSPSGKSLEVKYSAITVFLPPEVTKGDNEIIVNSHDNYYRFKTNKYEELNVLIESVKDNKASAQPNSKDQEESYLIGKIEKVEADEITLSVEEKFNTGLSGSVVLIHDGSLGFENFEEGQKVKALVKAEKVLLYDPPQVPTIKIELLNKT